MTLQHFWLEDAGGASSLRPFLFSCASAPTSLLGTFSYLRLLDSSFIG